MDRVRLVVCAIAVEGVTRSRDPGFTPPIECAQTEIAAAAHFQQCGSPYFCGPLSFRSEHFESFDGHSTGDGNPLASPWIPYVLAMEIAISRGATKGALGNTTTH